MTGIGPTFVRIVAVVLAVGTVAWIPLSGQWRADNAFLVPDLIFAAVLVGGALLPEWRAARAVLLVGYAMAFGVLTTAVATWLIDGRFPVMTVLGALMAAVGTVVLAREVYVTVQERDRSA
ncbi:hypothetical protein [Millisia brevis]|uniref:hypothetical protein n=1 Tax=Millisia brevis TaxID=264148 RepID=UPI000835312F|nr:hypothetical protein [Millisia brevis]